MRRSTTGDLVAISVLHWADDDGVPSTAIREISLLRDVAPTCGTIVRRCVPGEAALLVFEF